MTEILPHIHRIESVFGERSLTSYLLCGERTLLVDSGFAHTPADTLIPYLDSFGVRQIDTLVITHASGDHFGGNYAVKQHSPDVQIIAHALDAEAIAHHDTFIAEHVTFFQKQGVPLADMDPDSREFKQLHGPEAPVDTIADGDLEVDLGSGWRVTVLHAPGHTPGHLMVYDPRHRALFAGDALMGKGIPNIHGGLDMPPHYFEVPWYTQTTARARQLAPDHLYLTHYPPYDGLQVKQFLQDCFDFCLEFQNDLWMVLQAAPKPMTVDELIEASREIVGIPNATYQYGMLVLAHLKELARQGCVEGCVEKEIPVWVAKTMRQDALPKIDGD